MPIIIFGLDGASMANLGDAMKRTRLPNFETIMARGIASRMRSVYPFVTGPAWTSLFSGVNPGKHGIFDQYELTESGPHAPNMRNCQVPFLWDYLSWAGKTSLMVGIPFTYPAPKINGAFVTGSFSPRMSCYPDNLKEKFDLSGFEYGETSNEDAIETVLKVGARAVSLSMLDDVKKRMKTALELMDSSKWDLVTIVDALPDELFHYSFDDLELVDRMFKILDDWLGQILERLGDGDSLFVVSDHGFSGTDGVILINEWLRMKKYLIMKESVSSRVLTRMGLSWDLLSHPGIATDLYRKLARNAPGLLNVLKKPLRNKMILMDSQVDEKSSVVAIGSGGPVAWLSLRLGEDPALLNMLNRDLAELKDQGMLENTFRSTDIYTGQFATDTLGQIVIEATDGYTINTTRLEKDRLVVKPILTNRGHHRPDGILLSYGAVRLRGTSSPEIIDIVPTLLSAMKLPFPDYLDGQSLIDAPYPKWTIGVP